MSPMLRWLAIAASASLLSCASTGDTSLARSALVPAGKLRVAFVFPAFVYSIKDPASGELKGLGPDLARDMAQRLGAPVEILTYANPPALLAAGKDRQWDLGMMGISAERAAVLDFSMPFVVTESGYLVREGLPVQTIADVDRPGIRIGIFAKSSVDAELSKRIKNATLVRVPTLGEVYTLLASGKADAVAAAKPGLYLEAPKNPGSRVLDGSFLDEPIAIGVPKGRDPQAHAFVDRYIAQAKADGRIQAAIDRAGLRGVSVAK